MAESAHCALHFLQNSTPFWCKNHFCSSKNCRSCVFMDPVPPNCFTVHCHYCAILHLQRGPRCKWLMQCIHWDVIQAACIQLFRISLLIFALVVNTNLCIAGLSGQVHTLGIWIYIMLMHDPWLQRGTKNILSAIDYQEICLNRVSGFDVKVSQCGLRTVYS